MIQSLKNVVDASFDIFGARIGRLSTPESVCKVHWEISFKANLLQNSKRNSNVDCEINNGPILAFRVSKEALWMEQRHSLRVWIKIIGC